MERELLELCCVAKAAVLGRKLDWVVNPRVVEAVNAAKRRPKKDLMMI